MGRSASSQEFLPRCNSEQSSLKSSTCQLRTDPPFDVGTPKAPELADLHAANLAASCHSLQRLGVNPQDRGGLIAIQHPLYTPFDAWEGAATDPGGFFISSAFPPRVLPSLVCHSIIMGPPSLPTVT